MTPQELLPDIIKLAQEAGQATLAYWQKEFTVQHKNDNSPVTIADLTANQLITEGLLKLTPNIPILSEEACNIPLTTRQTWQQWWLIDPLDGTKEFIAGNPDFTINIALINNGHVVFGVVFIPATNRCYYGGKTLGAWRIDNQANKQPIYCRQPKDQQLSVIASRRHSSQKQQLFLEKLQQTNTISLKSAGSSLKFCLIAEAKADCYPRFSPTCQWDTAAAQGVLEGAGGNAFDEMGNILNYKPKVGYLNPNFIALGLTCSYQKVIFSIIKQLPKSDQL